MIGKYSKEILSDQYLFGLFFIIGFYNVYMNAAIKRLRKDGYQVKDGGLKHLSPVRHGHVNPYGRFIFQIEEEFTRKALRPLRQL